MCGTWVYWNTALKPTPNLPIVLPFFSSLVELPTPVIALMCPLLTVSDSKDIVN